ncbi:MAG TPA: mannitol dehydrogenase family protein [Methylocella sp.]|nr:mannitol dehydrogenase family protein [Methylocella sp.]
MTERLCALTLDHAAGSVRRPGYNFNRLRPGIVHLGVGAFHRAHQAVFTDDAILAAGGDWGVIGIALRRPNVPEALRAQDCLYTVETLSESPQYRVMGIIRRALTAPAQPGEVLAALAAPETHVISLTVTEKGYSLGANGGLDENHADIVHDLAEPDRPRSTIGWLVRGLAERCNRGSGPVTVISCDNLASNGRKLEAAVLTFAARLDALRKEAVTRWIKLNATFPRTVVDCIVPATTEASRSRVAAALGLIDDACVSREPFTQWVIEDRFAGPHPAWDRAGAELVADVETFEQLKLQVLNACHSALAYLGLGRGHQLVRQAIGDPELSRLVETMVAEEIAPALPELPVADYWRKIRMRFANPMIDHRLAQIGEDGSTKLAQRVFPLLIANARAGRPAGRLASIVRAWLGLAGEGLVKDPHAARLAQWAARGRDVATALDDTILFPAPFRTDPLVRAALLEVVG